MLRCERLENRVVPSAVVGSDGALHIQPGRGSGLYTYGVVVVQADDRLIVRERFQGHGTHYTTVPVAQVTSIVIQGQKAGRNVLENRTALPATMTGGDLADRFTCGNGYNLIGTGLGVDTVVNLRGGEAEKIPDKPSYTDHDIIYTRPHGNVRPNPLDTVIYVS